MPKIVKGTTAPDFRIADIEGNDFHLADQIDEKNVLLIFNRGFI